MHAKYPCILYHSGDGEREIKRGILSTAMAKVENCEVGIREG